MNGSSHNYLYNPMEIKLGNVSNRMSMRYVTFFSCVPVFGLLVAVVVVVVVVVVIDVALSFSSLVCQMLLLNPR